MKNDFYGLPTGSIGNQHLRLEYLSEAGPRIVRLFLAGSDENLLAEVPDIKWITPYGEYYVRGGHRLWLAPEIPERTYIPDNAGLRVEETQLGVRLVSRIETPIGIRKSIDVQLAPDRPALTLRHSICNESSSLQELAAWAITQLPLGGMAVLPQMVTPLDHDGFQPNRNLVLWPYSRWEDPRLELHDDIDLVAGNPLLPPIKIGYQNRFGWIGYYWKDIFFYKRFTFMADQVYPDFGCNVECYCNNRFIEVETLGPLCRLGPGQSTEHIEEWEFSSLPAIQLSIDGAREISRSLIIPH